MPLQMASSFIPKNGNKFFLLEDIYFKGGYQVHATTVSRDAIPSGNRKAGMLVYTQDDKKTWKLAPDLLKWDEASFGGGGGAGARAYYTHDTPELQPNGYEDFDLPLGKSAILLKVGLSVPMLLEAYSTAARDDPNPYAFKATSDHLEDDGSTLMSDGSLNKNSRFLVLSNMEDPSVGSIYFRVTNHGVSPSSTTVKVTAISME